MPAATGSCAAQRYPTNVSAAGPKCMSTPPNVVLHPMPDVVIGFRRMYCAGQALRTGQPSEVWVPGPAAAPGHAALAAQPPLQLAADRQSGGAHALHQLMARSRTALQPAARHHVPRTVIPQERESSNEVVYSPAASSGDHVCRSAPLAMTPAPTPAMSGRCTATTQRTRSGTETRTSS